MSSERLILQGASMVICSIRSSSSIFDYTGLFPAADVDGTHRTHLVAAIAADALLVIDMRLMVLNLNGMRRAALGTLAAADAFVQLDARLWRKQMLCAKAHGRLQKARHIAGKVDGRGAWMLKVCNQAGQSIGV